MNSLVQELMPQLPALAVLITALLVVFVNLYIKEEDSGILPMLSLGGCLAGLAILFVTHPALTESVSFRWFETKMPSAEGTILQNSFVTDGFGLALTALALIAGALAIMGCAHERPNSAIASGEFYAVLLLAVSGMIFLVQSADFLTLLVSLEIMSIATYVLAGAHREDGKSTESALKYLILGGFSTAFLMLGIAFVYGATGSLSLTTIQLFGDGRDQLLYVGLALFVIGLLFKVGAVPFHFWVPDVYEGAPAGVTGLMAVGVKAAAFAILARIFFGTFSDPVFMEKWYTIFKAAAIVTMVLGNLIALRQTNIKRMLAYSGIAHTGYLLLAFLVQPGNLSAGTLAGSTQAIVFYLFAYGIMTLGAFGVIALIREDGRRLETMDDFKGLAKEHAGLALCMSIFMFSMAGMPPFAGFFAKFLVFKQAIMQGEVLVAVLGILSSIASLYYYLRVLVMMYFSHPEAERLGTPVAAARCQHAWTVNLLVYGAGASTLLLGIAPHWLSILYRY